MTIFFGPQYIFCIRYRVSAADNAVSDVANYDFAGESDFVQFQTDALLTINIVFVVNITSSIWTSDLGDY